MRLFAIVNSGKRKASPCAFLIYVERDKTFSMVIRQDQRLADLPRVLASFAQRGIYTLDHEQSMAFVRERISAGACAVAEAAPHEAPRRAGDAGGEAAVTLAAGSSSANAETCHTHGAFELLVANHGRSALDDFSLAEIPVTVRTQEAVNARRCSELVGAYEEQRSRGAEAAGRLIKRARKDLGWSQEQLAARAGVQQAVVSRVENGRTNPTVRLLEDLAEAMGKRIEIRLVDGVGGAGAAAAGVEAADVAAAGVEAAGAGEVADGAASASGSSAAAEREA